MEAPSNPCSAKICAACRRMRRSLASEVRGMEGRAGMMAVSNVRSIQCSPWTSRMSILKLDSNLDSANRMGIGRMLCVITMRLSAVGTVLLVAAFAAAQGTTPNARPRASELGLKIGILPTGPLDAITDVAGVEVGHTTIIRGENIRTGVTAVV